MARASKSKQGVNVDWKQIVAGILVGAVLGIGATFFIMVQRITRLETQIERFTITPDTKPSRGTTTIQISAIKDEGGHVVAINAAPRIIEVEGRVSGTEGLFVYLIVNDGYADWVQRGLGANVRRAFTGRCYLGAENQQESLNKFYRVFAVVTSKEHGPYDQYLDRNSIASVSEEIKLFRTQ